MPTRQRFYRDADRDGFGNPDEELFKRWIEFAALCPLHRFHHHYPWPSPEEAGPEGRGAEPNFPWRYEAEGVSRTYITLRQRLLPYLYSCIADAVLGIGLEPELGSGGTGIPLMRAMALEFPDDAAMHDLDEQFMCGPSLLSAPVLERGARTKRVYLPAGAWYDFYTDEVHDGSGELVCDAPLDRLPLFVRAGAIIPLGPAMQHVGERPVDPLTLEVYPRMTDGASAFVLYEDDGETFDYERGAWCTTRSECAVVDVDGTRRVELSIGGRVEGEVGFRPAARSYELRFHGCGGAGVSVWLDGVPLARCGGLEESASRDAGWAVDEAAGVVVVKVADTAKEQTITLGGLESLKH